MMTQQLNRVELVGTIGNVGMSSIGVDGKRVANFGVATNFIYKDADGTPVIETTWHNVVAFEGVKDIDFDSIRKKCKVHVIGRLKERKYTDINNAERAFYEIVASTVKAIPDYEIDEGFTAQTKQ